MFARTGSIGLLKAPSCAAIGTKAAPSSVYSAEAMGELPVTVSLIVAVRLTAVWTATGFGAATTLVVSGGVVSGGTIVTVITPAGPVLSALSVATARRVVTPKAEIVIAAWLPGTTLLPVCAPLSV